jgi:hypothetical protein
MPPRWFLIAEFGELILNLVSTEPPAIQVTVREPHCDKRQMNIPAAARNQYVAG